MLSKFLAIASWLGILVGAMFVISTWYPFIGGLMVIISVSILLYKDREDWGHFRP